MTTYLLVPGAWGGAWMWDAVARDLRGRGHEAHAVTLPGLSAHSDEPADGIGLADHVAYVRGLLAELNQRGVVLVGHSYAGLVTAQAAAAEPERVGHAVFVDSNLPSEGRSMVDGWSREGQERVRADIAAHGGRWSPLTAEDLADQDLTPGQAELFVSRSVPHPGRTILDPAVLERPLAALTATYVNCTVPSPEMPPEARALVDAPGWTFTELPTGHWPMLSRPEGLAEILAKVDGGGA